jgi:hypothetical protein
MPTLSLEDIQRRIAQRDSELQALRQELAGRQSQLTSLTRRRQELQSQLQLVDSEIAALEAGKPSTGIRPKAPQPAAATTQTQATLPALLVALLREAGRPLTATQLADEAKRQGFQSRSGNLAYLVQTRIGELRKRGVVRRAANQPGYTLAQATKGTALKTDPKKPAGPGATAKLPAKPVASSKSAASAKATKQPSLREVLTQILKKSGRSMTRSELADAALKAGYRTASSRPADVVWAMLNQMDNVEHVKGQGYRLKKSKG